MTNQQEANARIRINKLLEQVGWRLIDDENGRANVSVEDHLVSANSGESDSLGDDFEHTNGYADYVIWDQDRRPLAVLEAKRSSIDPLNAKEQARAYAQHLKVKWVLLSNGSTHYQWNMDEGNPELISRFPSQESLAFNVKIPRDVHTLLNEVVSDDYIALTQNPQYKIDPRWQSAEGRAEMMFVDKLRFLRPYQLAAIQSLQTAITQGKKRFLFEMATGTGKTLTSAAIIKLFIKTQNASRVLFLVDRIELERQAFSNFRDYLKPDIHTVIFKEHKSDWQSAEVVVTTIQSIMHDNKFEEIFSPNDFDLIISDEAHRAISGVGASRDVFEYFQGYKLGLTATPKDYLKNLDQKSLSENDPREIEQRVLFSTYKTFGCESGTPTFRYSLLDGVKDKNLINPYVLDCRTKVTTQLLSDEGYAIAKNPEDDGEEDEIYHASDFEKKFFSPDTNRQFVDVFFQKALHDPLSEEIGKTLIFCASQAHARKITQLLNEYAMEKYPQMYNSDFAVQITSDVMDAQSFAVRFANNNLNGTSRFLPGYKTSKTRVCITVGMMTTGYDCPDLLNICLMRPIFSPQDFVQIKGRGTRTYTFSYEQRIDGKIVSTQKAKSSFRLFDYFANCEFFQDKYPYEEVLKLPEAREITIKRHGENFPETVLIDFMSSDVTYGHTRSAKDLVLSVREHQIGEAGMPIDSKLYRALQDAAYLQNKQEKELIEGATHLWQEFISMQEIPTSLQQHAKDVFFYASLDPTFLVNLQSHQFSRYTDQPEVFSMLETLGKDWLDTISQFLTEVPQRPAHAH